MTPIQQVIAQFFQSSDDWQARIIREWPLIMGDLAQRMCIKAVRADGSVILGVYDPHWLNELRMLDSMIIDKINNYFNTPVVTRVCLSLTQVPGTNSSYTYTKAPQTTRALRIEPGTQPLRGTPRTPPLSPIQQRALTAITDKDLQSVLQRFWSRCVVQNTFKSCP